MWVKESTRVMKDYISVEYTSEDIDNLENVLSEEGVKYHFTNKEPKSYFMELKCDFYVYDRVLDTHFAGRDIYNK